MNNLINEKDKNIFLKSYVDKFGFPNALPMATNYDDEVFEKLMAKALQRNKPLTNEEIYEAFKNKKYDLVGGNNDMEETKIRKLLKKYGAEDTEIENFMQDLADFKEDEEHDLDIDKNENQADTEVEDDEEYLLNADNRDKLKLTKEGTDLIINAPKMAKEELAEAIKKLLNN